MRKGLLVLILFSLTLSLFASEIYKSNELGQKLSLESSIGQEGYFLEVDGAVETLYLDGSVYLTVSTYDVNNIKTVTKNYASGKQELYTYEDGLLKSCLTDTSSYVYNYIDNRLVFCIVDGSEVFFLRSSSDGTLIAIKRDSEVQLIGSSYLYQNGSFYNVVSNNLVFTGTYQTLEDGSFTFVDGEKTYHYSESGLLLSVISSSETVTYSYEEGVLASVTTTKADLSYSVSAYESGTLQTITEYDTAGQISSFTSYNNGKMVRTVYKNGRPVADIYYKDDNVTVESIKYR